MANLLSDKRSYIYDEAVKLLLGEESEKTDDEDVEEEFIDKKFVQNIFYVYVYDSDLEKLFEHLNAYGVPRKLLSNPQNTLNEYEIYCSEDLFYILKERLRNSRIVFKTNRWWEYTKYAAINTNQEVSNNLLQYIKTSNEAMQIDTASIKLSNDAIKTSNEAMQIDTASIKLSNDAIKTSNEAMQTDTTDIKASNENISKRYYNQYEYDLTEYLEFSGQTKDFNKFVGAYGVKMRILQVSKTDSSVVTRIGTINFTGVGTHNVDVVTYGGGAANISSGSDLDGYSRILYKKLNSSHLTVDMLEVSTSFQNSYVTGLQNAVDNNLNTYANAIGIVDIKIYRTWTPGEIFWIRRSISTGSFNIHDSNGVVLYEDYATRTLGVVGVRIQEEATWLLVSTYNVQGIYIFEMDVITNDEQV